MPSPRLHIRKLEQRARSAPRWQPEPPARVSFLSRSFLSLLGTLCFSSVELNEEMWGSKATLRFTKKTGCQKEEMPGVLHLGVRPAPLSGGRPSRATPGPRGPTLPVQVESCDLSIVSLEVNEVEEVGGCLFISLLSGRKGRVTPWTQTWGAGA